MIEEKCPVCKGTTTLLIIPPQLLFDNLVRFVVTQIATLGTKIELLADEIKTHNKIETDKKNFNQLKSQVISMISKKLREGIDAAESNEQDSDGPQDAA